MSSQADAKAAPVVSEPATSDAFRLTPVLDSKTAPILRVTVCPMSIGALTQVMFETEGKSYAFNKPVKIKADIKRIVDAIRAEGSSPVDVTMCCHAIGVGLPPKYETGIKRAANVVSFKLEWICTKCPRRAAKLAPAK